MTDIFATAHTIVVKVGSSLLIDAKTGALEKILPAAGALKAGFGGVEWSPDNQRLFLTTNQGGEFFELAVYELATKKLSVLSKHIPWDIENFSLSKDGKRLLAVVNNNGRDEVRLFDAASGKVVGTTDIPLYQPGGRTTSFRGKLLHFGHAGRQLMPAPQ